MGDPDTGRKVECEMKFRELRADEIECRVSMVKKNGLSLLLYKDARVDQNVLDETFGLFGWQKSYQLIGDRLYCTVAIENPQTGQWIAKQDVGTESYTEKEKGQASDAFKRACFNWGIGRELYTAPFIWVPAESCKIVENGGKYTSYDRFSVKSIAYSEETGMRRISGLQIMNDGLRKVVYTMGNTEDKTEAVHTVLRQKINGREDILQNILTLCKKEKLADVTAAQAASLLKNWDKVEVQNEKLRGGEFYGV